MAAQLDLSVGYMLGPELGAIIVENYVGSVDDHGWCDLPPGAELGYDPWFDL